MGSDVYNFYNFHVPRGPGLNSMNRGSGLVFCLFFYFFHIENWLFNFMDVERQKTRPDPVAHCSKLWIRTDYDKLKKI